MFGSWLRDSGPKLVSGDLLYQLSIYEILQTETAIISLVILNKQEIAPL